MRLILDVLGNSGETPKPDTALIKMIANAHQWWEDLITHRFPTIRSLAHDPKLVVAHLADEILQHRHLWVAAFRRQMRLIERDAGMTVCNVPYLLLFAERGFAVLRQFSQKKCLRQLRARVGFEEPD